MEESITGRKLNWRDTGIENSGKLLNDNEVNSYPDFAVEGYGLIESKFALPVLKEFFHIKCGQVNNYIKLEASVLMVHGAETDNPQFTIIGPESLKNIKLWCEVINWQGFGGKKSYRVPLAMFVWRPLCSKP